MAAPTHAQRATSAINAMKEIGIDPSVTKAALRKLIREFEFNWKPIEDENYRLLADYIFDNETRKEEQDACSRKNKTKSNLRSRQEKTCRSSSPDDSRALSLSNSRDIGSSKRTSHNDADDHRSKDNVDHYMRKKKKAAESNFKREEQHRLSSSNDSRALTVSFRPKPGSSTKTDQSSHTECSTRKMNASNTVDADQRPKREVVSDATSTGGSTSEAGNVRDEQLSHAPCDERRQIDPIDVTNGQERVEIKLVHDMRKKLPSFYYIAHNIIFKNAHVNISLDRIGDENCCPSCSGDCLKAAIPCACARETGGEYAYTSEGLVREDFLESCISMNQSPKEHDIYYCKDCPLERIKNEFLPEQCKGHVIKRFIKECWSKCGCNRKCGNRVVQRGITCNLQICHIDKRKGWGLCSIDNLPKGTFICEYVGEILTNMELYDRTMTATCNDKHTYPVTLDADWACEQFLEDEEALCLDATYYGNVARFVNHSCDPNLVAVPVEIETPDHHYYHLAFFTTRNIEAYEELCWDYGIDFDDHSHPIKAFTCFCGSKNCRDKNRLAKTGAAVAKN